MKSRDSEQSGPQSAIILAGVVVVVAVLAVLFGLQTLVSINAKQRAAIDPWLNDTPQPLPASSSNAPPTPPTAPADKKGKPGKPPQLRAYDYEFAPPWPGNATLVPGAGFVKFQFPSGQVIAFLDPGAQIDIVRQMKSGETTQYNQFTNVFGSELPNSNYDLYNVIYSASPAKFSSFMNRDVALRDNVLLLWKLSFGFDAQPGIHAVSEGKNRGFEFGDPNSGKPVALRIFDVTDKQARFIFTAASSTNGAFTQDDIDKVVESFQLIPVMER